MSDYRDQHPSGRPIPDRRVKMLGFRRVPQDEPLTPGLRRKYGGAVAIGFTARISSEDEGE